MSSSAALEPLALHHDPLCRTYVELVAGRLVVRQVAGAENLLPAHPIHDWFVQ